MSILDHWRGVAVLLLALAVCACGSAPEQPGPSADAGEVVFDAGPGYPYETEIRGAPQPELEELLQQALHLYTLAERPPASEARLRRRVESDLDLVNRALRSEGYLQGTATYEIVPPELNVPPESLPDSVPDSVPDSTPDPGGDHGESAGGATAPPKAKVVIDLEPGERFSFGGLAFEPSAIEGGPDFPSLANLGLELGTPARGAVVLAVEVKLVRWLQDQGRPHARFVKRTVTARSDTRQMFVVSTIDPGPALEMGRPTFSGLATVEQPYLETYLNWEPGDRASRTTLEAYQDRLYGTGLFESLSVTLPTAEELDRAAAGADGGEAGAGDEQDVPVSIAAIEAQHRSVGAGVSFSTVESFGVEGVLEHRNMFGSNETVRLAADIAVDDQRLGLSFEKPQFLLHNQKFRATATALHEDDDAFTITAYRLFAGIERQLTPRLSFTADVGAEHAEVTDVPIEGTSKLLLLPLTLTYDRSNDKLDPTTGYRLHGRLTPAGGTFRGDDLYFTTVDLTGSTYYAVDAAARHVVALRGRLGTLLGAERDAVPAHRRLFAGGGGSVRAYDRRYVGPIDVDDDPLGGRSVAEVGLEWRARVGENLGIVPFIEAGSVSEAQFPDFDQGVQAGYGLGVRYYTPIGPMRADVAFPIDRREVDDPFQFYISIGQAF